MGLSGKQVLWVLCIACILLPGLGGAEQEPSEPIYIESDSLDIDDRSGVSTYRGNVHFRRGTANLWADEIKIYAPERKEVKKIVAEGNPAKFQQVAKDRDEETSGQAERIEYLAIEALVILDGDARLQQGDNLFAGNRIEYDSEKKVVRAGKSVSPEGRVKILIQPEESDNPKEDGQKQP